MRPDISTALTAIHTARGVYGTDADNAYARREGLSAMNILRSEAARLFEDLFSRQQPTAEDQFFLARLYESIGFTLRRHTTFSAVRVPDRQAAR